MGTGTFAQERAGLFTAHPGMQFTTAFTNDFGKDAHFDGDWVGADKPVSAIELRRFALSKSHLLSIMPANRDAIVDFVGNWSSAEFWDRLRSWIGRVKTLADDEADEGPDLTPDGEDRRQAALRSIQLRRGQREFRDALLDRYRGKCAISGCSILGVLEAAHLRPYRGAGDNHPANGLLLRSDLHTLFDLDMLGIDPTNHRIAIDPLLHDSEYQHLEGVVLSLARESPTDPEALQLRWRYFCSARPP